MLFANKALADTLITLCVFATLQRSFVEPTPVNTSPLPGNVDNGKVPTPNFDEVKQLEDLKQSLANDGQLVARINQKVDTVGEDGIQNATPATHVHTEVDIPAENIHQVVEETVDPSQRQTEPITKRNRRPGIDDKYSMYRVQYSPRDMAEYVFWTGDEKRVTLAIEEFLEAGQMTREEAIAFLQDIKFNLDYLETHYSRQDMFRRPEAQNQYAAEEGIKGPRMQQSFTKHRPGSADDYKLGNIELEKKDVVGTPIPSTPSVMQDEPAMARGQMPQANPNLSEDDYAELLERLKVADYLYTEYSLEEVIYQLAKVMFAQSITRGSNEAQQALQTFTNYLAAEAEMGRISKSLQKKVLDVLIASLTDTLAEHPKIMSAALLSLAPKEPSTVQSANMLLHQILLLNPQASKQTPSNDVHQLGKLNAETVLGEHQSYRAKEREINDTGNVNKIKPSVSTGKDSKAN